MPHFYDTVSDGQPMFVTALPNARGAGIPARWIYARSADDIEQFLKKHDSPGKAVYFAVARLKNGAEARSTETVKETLWLWADVDFKHHPDLTPEEITKRVMQMRNPPTLIVRSGHGLHLYWRLHEPEDLTTPEARHRVIDALKLACQHVSGDPSVCEVARLMRLPGSHNTKYGDYLPVEVLAHNEHEYDLDELTDWWLEARPCMPEPTSAPGGDGHATDESPFTAFAGDQHKAPIDVEVRLANMRYQGQGDTSIHMTQLQCTGALLRHGIPLEDVTAQVLAATKQAVAGDARCAGWDWHEEERAIERMSMDLINKDHTLAPCLPTALWEKFQAAVAGGKKPRLVWQQNYGLHVRGLSQATPQPLGAAAADGATVTPLPREHAAPGIEAKPFKRFDPAKLPRREWLYGGHYQRGVLTATVGPGAGGKSSLDLTELIAMCTARNLLGEQPTARVRAWYHNAEDSLNEIYRRIAAICQHYAIDQSELEGWLFVTSGVEMPIQFATSRMGKVSLDAVTTAAITRTITDNEIGVSSFDPLVAHHTVTENATGDMDQVCRELARIANSTDCATELVHHTRKPAPGQEELSVIDSRGAGAIINAVRSARVLNPMSKGEADKAGIDDVDRRLHFRIDNGKANMAPPSAARWRKFVGVDLPNGDNVGVVTAWEYPTSAAMAAVDLPDAVCAQIQVEVTRQEYKAAVQSPDWIGNLIARLLRIDRSTKPGKAATDRYLQVLYNKGVITTAEGTSTSGHTVRLVIPGAWVPSPPTQPAI